MSIERKRTLGGLGIGILIGCAAALLFAKGLVSPAEATPAPVEQVNGFAKSFEGTTPEGASYSVRITVGKLLQDPETGDPVRVIAYYWKDVFPDGLGGSKLGTVTVGDNVEAPEIVKPRWSQSGPGSLGIGSFERILRFETDIPWVRAGYHDVRATYTINPLDVTPQEWAEARMGGS